ncbi:hypothetical protein KCU83_g7407, partial [Aureobasidium melanogenum]
MPLICNLWPRCRHVQWHDDNGGQIEPILEMLPTVEVAVYPWRCKTCAELGYPYYVPRDSHLMNAEIGAEQVLRAAKSGDSFEEIFREADLAAFYEAPKDDYHEGPLGGWGPGAGWDPEIPDYDMSSPTSSCPSKEDSSINTSHDDTSSKSVNNVSSTMALDDQPPTIALHDQPSTNVLSRGSTISPSKNSFQTAALTTPVHREFIGLTSESEEVSYPASSSCRDADSRPHSTGNDAGYHSKRSQGTFVPSQYSHTSAHSPYPSAMVASTFHLPAPATLSSHTPASAVIPGAAAAASPFSRAPAAASTAGGPASTTMGLTLVFGGVTYPRIENWKERWYTQRPGRSNSYSKYSDLAKFDTSKGVRVAPKASRAQLEAARRYHTFG